MTADHALCERRAKLVGKRFCSDINNPNVFVTVLEVNRASRGFRVVYKYPLDPVTMPKELSLSYTAFVLRFPHELINWKR